MKIIERDVRVVCYVSNVDDRPENGVPLVRRMIVADCGDQVVDEDGCRWTHATPVTDAVPLEFRRRSTDVGKKQHDTRDMCPAADILKTGAQHIEDRAAVYDKAGERSIPATVDAFNAITGGSMTAEQGWLFMAMLKAVRSQQGDFKQDNYEDGAAYFALMCEQGSKDR